VSASCPLPQAAWFQSLRRLFLKANAQNQIRCGLLDTKSQNILDVRLLRPCEVKRFQTIHRCSVDVAYGLALLSFATESRCRSPLCLQSRPSSREQGTASVVRRPQFHRQTYRASAPKTSRITLSDTRSRHSSKMAGTRNRNAV
jgi:hypothetical protein